jgi:alpha-glucosidase (family GH31 glycosyl hydrolase)
VVFARWTALGALTPFMQLHGRANITPWTVEQTNDEITAIYRFWSKLHSELVPFFYSLAEVAYAGGPGIVRPLGGAGTWPGDYRYLLGEAFLVAPVLDASGLRDVELPEGARYYDFWAPAADPLDGGQVLAGYDATAIERIPLFVREGAIVPLAVRDGVTNLGTPASAGSLTVLVYPGAASEFSLRDEDDAETIVSAVRIGPGARIDISRTLRTTLLRVRADAPATAVTIDAAPATEHATRDAFDAAASGWFAEPSTRSVWVKLPAGGARTAEVE